MRASQLSFPGGAVSDVPDGLFDDLGSCLRYLRLDFTPKKRHQADTREVKRAGY
jgi:hypothetical protein